MLRRQRLMTFCCMVFSSAILSAGVIRHDVADANYLALGNSSDYASVGRINFTTNSDWASGVLIGNQWVLTAGHVIRSNYLNNTPGNVLFTVGGTQYTASELYLNPGYVHNQPTNGNDIALIKLSAPVLNVDPAQIYTGISELTQTGTYVGFGRTGTGLTGQVPSPATKRGGTNVIDVTANQIDNSWSSNILVTDFDQPGVPSESSFGSAIPTALEYMPAEKDSGAGLFIEENGDIYLAGIMSFVLFDTDGINYNYGDAAAATRVSAHVPWINSVVPELSTTYLLLVPAAALVVRHWRRRS